MWITSLTVFISIFIIFGDTSPTAVLILARGGSKGLRLKNLQEVGGRSLIRIAAETARNAGFHDITVSTDHPLIALEGVKCNVTVFHRSAVTASDWAPSIWGAKEFLSFRPDVEILVLMQATSPFVKSSHLKGALKKLYKPIANDCVFSVSRSFKLRWQFIKGQIHPANFKADRRPRRQDWEGEFLETGSFYIARKSLIEQGLFQNNNCTVLEISSIESLEIDTNYDLQAANVLLEANLV